MGCYTAAPSLLCFVPVRYSGSLGRSSFCFMIGIVLSCLVLSCLVFYLALPYLVLPCLVLSCPVLSFSCLALPCLVLCLFLSCLALSALSCCHTTPWAPWQLSSATVTVHWRWLKRVCRCSLVFSTWLESIL